MTLGSRIIFLPGEVSIDILDALKRAMEKLRPARSSRPKTNGGPRTTSKKKNRPVLIHRLGGPPTFYPVRYVKNPPRSIEETKKEKAARVKRELIDAGISIYGLLKSEARNLHKVLHSSEHIEAIVYGQHHSNSVMLIATNERVIYFDKKPMALFMDEVSYEVISGIEFEVHTLFATLILHTPVKNYDIHYANLHCAEKFARHIEAQRLKRETPEPEEPEVAPDEHPQHVEHEELEDMAGYYWLPTEEEEKRR